MSLRTGFLLCLFAIALASAGLYFGLSRSGGVGLPGGKSALEQALAPYVAPGSLSVSEPRAALAKDRETVALTLRSATFDVKGSGLSLALRRITAEVDGGRLAQGVIRFKAVTIGGATATLETQNSGEEARDPVSAQTILAAIEEVYSAAFDDISLSRLDALDIQSLQVRILSGQEAIADARGSLQLKPAGQSVHLNAGLDWTLAGDASGRVETRLFAMGGSAVPLDAALRVSAPVLSWKPGEAAYDLSGLSLDVSLDLTDRRTAHTNLALTATALNIADDTLFDGETRLGDVVITAAYDASQDQLDLTQASFDLGQSSLTASGAVAAVSGDAQGTLDARLADMPVATLKRFWPKPLGKGGRLWVADNIERGQILSPIITVRGAVDDFANDTVPDEALGMTFGLSGITAHYRRPMPPLENAAAQVTMNLAGMRFAISKGQINGVDAAGSTVLLTDFRAGPQRTEIDLRLKGQASALAAALDSPPLEYFSAYDLSPTALNGEFSGRALIAMPLIKALLLDDIRLSARVDARQLALAAVLPDQSVDLSRLVIEVTQNAMALRGDYSVDGLTGALRWDEDFTGATETPTAMNLTGQIAPNSLPRWLPAAADTVFGTLFYDAALTGRGFDIANGTLSLDLSAASLNIPELGYDKPVGEPGSLKADFAATQETLMLGLVTVNAPDLFLSLEGELARDGSSGALSLPAVEVGETRGTLNLSGEEGRWLLAGQLATLDVRPVIDLFWEGRLTPQADEESSKDSSLSVSIDADVIQLKNDQRATKTRFLGRFEGSHVAQLNVFGQGPGDAPFTLTIEPIEAGRRLFLAADQAGPLAGGLDMLTSAEGGRLSIQASSYERGEEFGLAGILEMTDIRLTQTPVLARLLGLGSLSGVADLARNRGINFTNVEVPFELGGGVVRITNASAFGPALGLTANGEFLDSLEQADIRGVLVPSYTINSALGRVPVLGDLLMGGENAGLFGINYQVSGALDNPELSVNPASVLTPGFLRGVFGPQRGRLEEVSSQPLGTPEGSGQTFNP